MFRNSLLYRRLWYVKKRNMWKLHIYTRITVIVIIFALLINYAQKEIFPSIIETSEIRINKLVSDVAVETIKSNFLDTVKYEDLIWMSKDENGFVADVKTDTVEMDKILKDLSMEIRKSLAGLHEIEISMGSLLGISAFEGIGPKLGINEECQNTKVSVESKFLRGSYGQALHKINFVIETKVVISIPFSKKSFNAIIEVPFVEGIISINEENSAFIN